jgi:hypothetical protein
MRASLRPIAGLLPHRGNATDPAAETAALEAEIQCRCFKGLHARVQIQDNSAEPA